MPRRLSDVYARYLRQLLSLEGGVDLAMVQELGALRRGIGLRWNATDSVHTAEAREFLDGEPPPRDPESLPTELQTLLWLSSTLYATSKQQANTTELAAVLGADEASSQRLLDELSRPIYRNVVAKAVARCAASAPPWPSVFVLPKVASLVAHWLWPQV